MLTTRSPGLPQTAFHATACFLICLPFTLRLWLLETRPFDPDEFEHLHGAWLISKGLLPYRDYFEHHTPLFHYLLAPFYGLFQVDVKPEDAIGFLFFSRRLMWLLTGAILILTFRLGQLWRNTRVGFAGALFLGNTAIFLETTLEVRPDMLAVVCWLLCLLMLIGGTSQDRSGKQAWRFICSGLFLGAGIMATQKVLFLLPGLFVVMVVHLFGPQSASSRRTRIRNWIYQFAGLCIPILGGLAYFYWKHGIVEFVQYNLFFNLNFKERFTPYRGLHGLMFDSPYFVLSGITGAAWLLGRAFKRNSFSITDVLLLSSTVGAIVGLFIMPVPYSQYYLLGLPILAVVAAAFLIETCDKLAALRVHAPGAGWILRAATYSFVVATFLILVSRGAGSPHPLVMTIYWFAAFAGAMALVFVRIPGVALIAFVLAISIPPLKRTHDVFAFGNTDQLDEIRYIIEETTPADTIMDGFTGTGVFRPHAYFYFFPHQGIQPMLRVEDRQEFVWSLQSGRVSPKIIVFDKYLRVFSPALTAYMRQRYYPVGIGEMWRRKD